MERTKRTEEERHQKKLEKNKRYYYKHREEILAKQSIYQKEHRKDIALTEEELSKMDRDNLGRFKVTNGNQKYKRVQRNGKIKQLHVLIWEEHNKKELPIGWVVHHKNKDKKDNRIENLESMPLSEHTKMHFEEYYKDKDVWNKGLPREQQPNYGRRYKFKESSKRKQKCSWFNKYLDSNIEIWKLKDNGKTPTQISKELNLTTHQVNHRWKGFTKVINPSSGRLI